MLFSLTAFSQIKFESGYYINNNNDTITGLIKNVDWRNNPTAFEFKSSEQSDSQNIAIDYAKEFGIYSAFKYVRADIDIERTSLKINNLQRSKEPVFTNERLYLKCIVSGTFNLFKYEDTGIEKFFYSASDDNIIKQLIYFKYLATAEEINNDKNLGYSSVLSNELYKRQLWIYVKCDNTSQNDIKNLEYKEGDLISYFKKVNECKGDLPTVVSKSSKSIFNLKVVAAYNFSKLTVSDFSSSYSPEFSDSNFSFGFETELILGFNRNKWSLVLEPTYNVFKGEKTTLPPFGISSTPEVASSELKFIQIPFGARHYFFLTKKSKLFVNALGNIRIIDKNSSVNYESRRSLYFSQTSFSFAGGLGATVDKFSLEARYYLKSNITKAPFIPIDFNNFSFILRYQIFSR